jgi:hypothetical protein
LQGTFYTSLYTFYTSLYTFYTSLYSKIDHPSTLHCMRNAITYPTY